MRTLSRPPFFGPFRNRKQKNKKTKNKKQKQTNQTDLRQRLLVLARHSQIVERICQRPAHQELHRQVIDALRVRVLEVHVGVVPRLDQPVAQRVASGQVGLEVVERVAPARERVLDVLDDRLLDREDVGLGVGVHQVGQELLLGRLGRGAAGAVAVERRRRRALGGGPRGALPSIREQLAAPQQP